MKRIKLLASLILMVSNIAAFGLIAKVKVLDINKSTNISNNKFDVLNIKAVIVSGDNKGKEVNIRHFAFKGKRKVYNIKIEKYDIFLARINKIGNKLYGYIITPMRDKLIMFFAIIFIVIFLLIARKKGAMSLIALAISLILFYLMILIPIQNNNKLYILYGFLAIMLSSIITFVLISDGKKKRILGPLITIIVSAIIYYISTLILKGLNISPQNLSDIGYYIFEYSVLKSDPIPLIALLFTIAISGSVMDSAMSMLSSIESSRKNLTGYNIQDILNANRSIGIDIATTMCLTLFFGYAAVMMPLMIFVRLTDTSITYLLNWNYFLLELYPVLIGMLAIIMSILISLIIGFIVYFYTPTKLKRALQGFLKKGKRLAIIIAMLFTTMGFIQPPDADANKNRLIIDFLKKTSYITTTVKDVIKDKNNTYIKVNIDNQDIKLISTTDTIKKGDKVIITRYNNGKKVVYEFFKKTKKPFYIIIIISIIVLLIFMHPKRFYRAVLSITLAILIYYLFSWVLIGESYNFWAALIINFMLIFFVVLLAVGFKSAKTLPLIVSSFISILVIMIMFYFFHYFMRIRGFSNEFIVLTTYLATTFNIKLGDMSLILYYGAIIGVIGVVIDSAMVISSSVYETFILNPEADEKRIFESGLSIGRDSAGTMVNTLAFIYFSQFFYFMLTLPTNNFITLLTNSEEFAIFSFRSITSIVAIGITVPVSAFVSTSIFKYIYETAKKKTIS